MTLNEARDILVALDPERTICVGADDCWYHPHSSVNQPPTNETRFLITVFSHGGGVDKQFEGPSLAEAVEAAGRWVTTGPVEQDEPVEAVAEN